MGNIAFILVLTGVVIIILREAVRSWRMRGWRDGWEWYATREAKEAAYKRRGWKKDW